MDSQVSHSNPSHQGRRVPLGDRRPSAGISEVRASWRQLGITGSDHSRSRGASRWASRGRCGVSLVCRAGAIPEGGGAGNGRSDGRARDAAEGYGLGFAMRRVHAKVEVPDPLPQRAQVLWWTTR